MSALRTTFSTCEMEYRNVDSRVRFDRLRG